MWYLRFYQPPVYSRTQRPYLFKARRSPYTHVNHVRCIPSLVVVTTLPRNCAGAHLAGVEPSCASCHLTSTSSRNGRFPASNSLLAAEGPRTTGSVRGTSLVLSHRGTTVHRIIYLLDTDLMLKDTVATQIQGQSRRRGRGRNGVAGRRRRRARRTWRASCTRRVAGLSIVLRVLLLLLGLPLFELRRVDVVPVGSPVVQR
ncbi:hypothetical protein C8T65DRAFT_266334 [Cerioporus squamosus]|nr:hypothetical protein C8T65DRAFT_266334 [Cerioporus squamosus]